MAGHFSYLASWKITPSVWRRPAAQPAHAMAHGDAIDAARAAHRPVMDREDHRLALAQRHHLGARLHARPLLGEHEFAAVEVVARLRRAGPSPAAERRARHRGPGAGNCSRRGRIAGAAASACSGRPCGSARDRRRARRDSARRRPSLRSSGWRSRRAADRAPCAGGDRRGQRIGEVLVLAAAEAVPGHDHPAAEALVRSIESPASAAHSAGVSTGQVAQPWASSSAAMAAQSSAATRSAIACRPGRGARTPHVRQWGHAAPYVACFI